MADDSSDLISPGFGPTDRRLSARTASSQQSRYSEIGRTGLRHWGGFLFEEFERDLQGRRGAENFREFAENDAVAGGILLAVETMVRKVDWWVEPCSDAVADQQAAEFYEQVLFEDMAESWDNVVSEILSMLTYGWSFFEICWKQRKGDTDDPTTASRYDDGRVGVWKLASRGQDALLHWDFKPGSDELVAMTQLPPPDYKLCTIPLDKALLFRTRIFKANPEGRSILRSAYFSYWALKSIRALEGIGIERDLAGLPVLTPPAGVNIWNTKDPVMVAMRGEAEKLVMSIRRDEQEGVLKPNGWELELLSPGAGGKRQFDTNAVIQRYERRVATSVLADLLLLGQDSVGSYALASSKEDLFAGVIDTQLNNVAAVFDSQFAPKLFKLNSFGGLTGLPRLKHGNVQGVDLETVGDFIQKLGMGGAPLWPNPEALKFLMEQAGLPAPPDDDELVPMPDREPKSEPTDEVIDTGDGDEPSS